MTTVKTKKSVLEVDKAEKKTVKSVKKEKGAAVVKVKEVRPKKVVKAIKEPSVKVKKTKAPVFEKTSSKAAIISSFGISTTDTGSPEVQVGLLTNRIDQLIGHLKTNKKDFDSRKGLLRMVGKRRRLLAYLSKKDDSRYQTVLNKVGLKR